MSEMTDEEYDALKKRIEAEPEEVSMVFSDGRLFARISWRLFVFDEPMPKGFEDWQESETKAHIKRFVARKLKMKVMEAKAQYLGTLSLAPESERERFDRAVEKREKRKSIKAVTTH